MEKRRFTINSLRYDRSVRRSWECDLIESSSTVIELVGKFDRDVEHPDLGSINSGTRSIEFFYTAHWYNHFIFLEPDGSLRNHYINICMPPEISDGLIEYVDLDIDLVLWPDGRLITLDLEEFDDNALAFRYPDSVRIKALETLAEATSLIEAGNFEKIPVKW